MIEIKHLSKTFQMKDGAVNALKNIDLTIPDGSIYGIIGMSGAGKSTLVRCINLLERPTEGSVVIDGTAMETLSPAALRERRRDITMIFQQFNLLMQRTCLRNVCFPMELSGVPKAQAEKKALELLDLVGLKEKASAYPAQLSGGMLQRVTMAILIGLSPRYIFADEPTSALDEENKSYLIQELARMKQQSAILFVSHDDAAIRTLCDELLVMQNGTIVERGTIGSLFASPREEWTKEFVRLASTEEGGGWTWSKSPLPM